MEIRKCTKSLGTLVIRPIEKNLAKSMIVANHYSHKWNDSFGIMNSGFSGKTPINVLVRRFLAE